MPVETDVLKNNICEQEPITVVTKLFKLLDGPVGWGREGNPINVLHRYIPRNGVGFLSCRSLNRVSFLPFLALCSRCHPALIEVPKLYQLKLRSVNAKLNEKQMIC